MSVGTPASTWGGTEGVSTFMQPIPVHSTTSERRPVRRMKVSQRNPCAVTDQQDAWRFGCEPRGADPPGGGGSHQSVRSAGTRIDPSDAPSVCMARRSTSGRAAWYVEACEDSSGSV